MEIIYEKTDINEIIETIDELELELIEFEHSYDSSVYKPDLVHLIFRHAHNLKSTLYTLNKSYSAKLIHIIESNFDLLRKGKGSVSASFIQTCLAGADIIKLNLSHETENINESESIIEQLEEMYHEQLNKKQEIQTIYLDLNCFRAPENNDNSTLTTYLVEKLIDSDISEEGYTNLFIYEDINEIGYLIKTIPDYKDLDRTNAQTILQIIFASKLNEQEIGMHIFDPLKPVIIESKNSGISKDIDDLALFDDQFFMKYFHEINELVKVIEEAFLKLENEPDKILITNIFAHLHNLRGNTGFLGVNGVEVLVNELENVLNNILEDKISFEKEIVSSTFASINKIKKLVNLSAPKIEDKSVNKLVESKNISVPVKSNADKKDIRVDTSKLDKLFDLVGELITAESMLLNSSELKKIDSPDFKKNSKMLSKITRELQEVTMSVRMVPLDGLFNRMKRVVRDLSHKTGKKINLVISGQETEMDKNIIEQISDPLVHIIRNAIDHGIEPESVRLEKNKNVESTLKLSARYEGNEIVISVEDDGRGLDKEKIIRKAQQKDLIKQAPESLKDKQVWNYIFEPGFSTADNISEISGRGVGLDIVKKNIEKLRGRIDIDSKIDRGSRFSFRIPLTLAIIDTMLFRIGNSHYAVPLLSINQSFRPSKDSITVTMDGQEVVQIRNTLFPVIRLHDVLNKEPETHDLDKGILIMIEGQNKKVCFFVDEIIGQQQSVIKGLDSYLGDVRGIMGCMILGNGEIGLIFDIESVIEMSEK